MAGEHTLGSYTFAYNPEKMTAPESKKTVAEVETYAGSDLFQWAATIVGQTIELAWTVIPEEMYDALRTLYLSMDAVTWNPQLSGTYQVVVTGLSGKYNDGSLQHNPYRFDVKLQINIRSFTAE